MNFYEKKRTSPPILVMTICDFGAGGAEKVFVNLANYLAVFYDVRFVVSRKSGPLLSILDKKIEVVDLNCKLEFFSIYFFRYLLKNKPDVVLSTLKEVNFSVIIAKILARSKAKIVIREANTLSAEFKFENKVKHKIKERFIRFFYPYSDAIVTLSNHMKKDLLDVIPRLKNDKLYTIYNPINFDEITIKSYEKTEFVKEEGTHYFLIVGRLYPSKGHILLFESLKAIKDKGFQFKCIVVGEGGERDTINQYVATNGLENEIHLIGYQSNPFKYMRLCDTFVLPSLFEGMPNSLLEAITLKKYCICSSSAGAGPEIISNSGGGQVFCSGDVNDLAQKLIDAISVVYDPRQAINYVNAEHDSDVIHLQYKEILDMVLSD